MKNLMEKHAQVQGTVHKQLHQQLDCGFYSREICQLIVGSGRAVNVTYADHLNSFMVTGENVENMKAFAENLRQLTSHIDEQKAKEVVFLAAIHFVAYSGAQNLSDMRAVKAVQQVMNFM